MVTITSMGSVQPDLTPDPGKISNASLADPMGDMAKPSVAMRPEAPPARVFRPGDDENVIVDARSSAIAGVPTTVLGVSLGYPKDRWPTEKLEGSDPLEALSNLEQRLRADGYSMKVSRVNYSVQGEDGSTVEQDEEKKPQVFKISSSADTIPSFLTFNPVKKTAELSGPLAKEKPEDAKVEASAKEPNSPTDDGADDEKVNVESEGPGATGNTTRAPKGPKAGSGA